MAASTRQFKTKTIFNKTVWLLAFISLFTDIASEMLFPIMPLYLMAIGFTPLSIGLLESFSDLILGFFKFLAPSISDRFPKLSL
jgi:hypothetical protein